MCMPQCGCGGQKTIVRAAAFLSYMCSGGQTHDFRPGSKQGHPDHPTEPSYQPMRVFFFDVVVLGSGSPAISPSWPSSGGLPFSVVSISCCVIVTSELSGI